MHHSASIAAAAAALLCLWSANAVAAVPAKTTSAEDVPAGTTIAKIGAEEVSLAVLLDRAREPLSTQQQRHERQQRLFAIDYARSRQELLETELGRYVDDRVLALEAAARQTTPLMVLGDVKTPGIADAEVRAFYEARRAQIEEPYDTVAPKIREFLLNQATDRATREYLDGLRRKYSASVQLPPLRTDVAPVGPARGSANAPVTIVEFSDFQCPYCARMRPVLEQLLEKYPGKLRLVYRHLPLTELHPEAQVAAVAAVCADAQGKFWELHDLMFADQGSLGTESLRAKAAKLVAKPAEFDLCLASEKAGQVVQIDVAAADAAGVAGTPAFFVNGRFLSGAVPLERLAALVDEELARNATDGSRH